MGGSKLTVGASLFVGSDEDGGRGLITLNGNAEILATGLEFGGKGSAILLDDDATINIAGGAKAENLFDAMIASGSIKPLHNEDRTIVVTTNSGNVMISVVSPTVTEAPAAPTAAPNNNVSTPTAASPTKSPTKAPTSSSCTDTTASFKVVGVKKAKTCANIATRATLCEKELKNTNTTPGSTFVKTICPVACNNCPPSDN